MSAVRYGAAWLVCALALAMVGCAPNLCNLPANAATAKCVLESNLISCGEQDAFALLPVVVSIVGNEINGAGFNAAAVEAQLEAQGIHDVPCVVAAVEQFVAPTQPALAQRFHEVVTVALKKKGAHGIATVNLGKGGGVTYVLQ